MNLKEFSKFMRMSLSGVKRLIYFADWKDIPRTKKLSYSIDKNGRKHAHVENILNKENVMSYFEKKFNKSDDNRT